MYLCLTWVSSAERLTPNHPACLGPSSTAVPLHFFPTKRPVKKGAEARAKCPGDTSAWPKACGAFRFSLVFPRKRGSSVMVVVVVVGGRGGLETAASAIISEALMQGGIHGALCNLQER